MQLVEPASSQRGATVLAEVEELSAVGASLCRQLGCHGTSNLRHEQGARPTESSIISHMRFMLADRASIAEINFFFYEYFQAPPVRQLQQFFDEYPGLVKFIGNILLSFFTPRIRRL